MASQDGEDLTCCLAGGRRRRKEEEEKAVANWMGEGDSNPLLLWRKPAGGRQAASKEPAVSLLAGEEEVGRVEMLGRAIVQSDAQLRILGPRIIHCRYFFFSPWVSSVFPCSLYSSLEKEKVHITP
jgi:hypothetical protein